MNGTMVGNAQATSEHDMPKLDKPTIFIVLPRGYEFAFRVMADWETEKGFGKRGETVRGPRSSFGTGTAYSKADVRWIKCETEQEADDIELKIAPLELKCRQLNRAFRDAKDELWNIMGGNQ